ncbi:hypothetical protein OC835_004615 [Tilletia horrida]|nr:hypothetical protein OC835_004615 [Tilletia horrida]
MGMLLAPYNNAMRLGQGFNSYTHEILIDDAVIVNPNREENVLTNDGNTMRLTAMVSGTPSAWTKQAQVILDVEQVINAQKAQDEKQQEQQNAPPAIEAPASTTETPAPGATEPDASPAQPSGEPAPASEPLKAPETEADTAPADVGAPAVSADSSASAPPGEASEPADAASSNPKPEDEPGATRVPEASETTAGGGAPQEPADATLTAAAGATTAAHEEQTGQSSDAAAAAKTEDVAETTGGNDSEPAQAPTDSSTASSEVKAEDVQAAGATDSSQDAAGSALAAPAEATPASGEADPAAASGPSAAPEGASGEASTPAPAEAKEGQASTVEGQAADGATSIAPATAAQTGSDGTDKVAQELKKDGTADNFALARQQADEEAKAAEAARAKKAEEERQKATLSKEVSLARQIRKQDPVLQAAADKYKVSLSLAEMTKMHREFRKLKSSVKVPPGMGKKTQVYNIRNSSGVSQTVIYQSQFVERLSDITSDLGISASLSIKKGSCGGAGRGSFIDTDKFKSSDLNYYISVRVINQSINFKDALQFNPLPGVKGKDFRTLFGDCFISGFLEGGELNALITMKVLNTAKARDITAEGAIALGKDSSGMTAEGAFKTAKMNLDLNSETTVQVSWIGGGQLKHPEEAWTIQSLTRAANRFPDCVAQSPQRTHAILTKYETLRSYQMNQPPEVSPIEYENAQQYANELLDIFMSYKAMYSRLTTQITEVQAGVLKFKKDPKEATRLKDQEDERTRLRVQYKLLADSDLRTAIDPRELSDASKKAVIGIFPSSLDGLDEARRATRAQMNLIIERVDKVDEDPSQILRFPQERFLPSFAFETLLPSVESTVRSTKRTAPLTGQRMFNTGNEKPTAVDATAATRMCLYDVAATQKDAADVAKKEGKTIQLLDGEIFAIKDYLELREEGVEESLRLTPPMGNEHMVSPPGKMFTALDFVQPTSMIKSVRITVHEGVICGLVCRYTNGLSWKRGRQDAGESFVLTLAKHDPSNPGSSPERITAVAITVGTEAVVKAPDFVLGLRLVTNKGQSVLAQAPNFRRAGYGRRFIGQRAFSDVRTITWESPLESGFMSGFWGWSNERGGNVGIFRLGVVWARQDIKKAAMAENEKMVTARQKDEENEDVIGEKEMLKRTIANLQQTAKEQEDAKNQIEDDLKIAQAAKEEALKQAQKEQERLAAEIEGKKSEIQQYLSTISTKDSEISQKQSEIQQQKDAVLAEQRRAAEQERLVTAERQAKEEATEQTKKKAYALYRAMKDTSAVLLVQHRSGRVLDMHPDWKKPTIFDAHRGWNQKFKLTIPSAGVAGLQIYCQNGSERGWFLLQRDGSSNTVTMDQDLATTFEIEPVPGSNEWYLLKNGGWFLGTEGGNGNSTLVISKSGTPTENDHWKFIWA